MSRVALVDSDGVLADFAQGLLDLHTERFGLPLNRNGTPMVSTDEWTHYRIEDQFEEAAAARMNSLMHEPGFFAALKPYTHSFMLTQMIREAGFEVDICTMPISRKIGDVMTVDPIAIFDKLGWFVRHFPHEAKGVVLTKRKSHVYGSVLIDDCAENIDRWCDHHTNGLGILFERPWNKHVRLEHHTRAVRRGSYAEAAETAIRHMNGHQRPTS